MMKHNLLFAAVAPLLTAIVFPAVAATSPAMTTCNAQWTEMTEADSVPEGLTWSTFWSKCKKDYASTHKTDTNAARAAGTTKIEIPRTIGAVNEDDPTGSSATDKDACDAKWLDYKARTKARGWKVYFIFMSKCMP